MGDEHYNRMLEAVAAELNSDTSIGDFYEIDDLIVMPIAANDNDRAWPHAPFPDGWIATN